MFSAITPAYNAEKYITQAMESVLAQGFEEWEMIVVDDGSTDRTCEIYSIYS
jgi:glycosyltransferase involved in cell wall biosynthesis